MSKRIGKSPPSGRENGQLLGLAGSDHRVSSWPSNRCSPPLKGMPGMGLSHSQVHDLLAFLLGAMACPSRSTIHHWVQAAAKAAGPVLKPTGSRLPGVGDGRLSLTRSFSTADRSW